MLGSKHAGNDPSRAAEVSRARSTASPPWGGGDGSEKTRILGQISFWCRKERIMCVGREGGRGSPCCQNQATPSCCWPLLQEPLDPLAKPLATHSSLSHCINSFANWHCIGWRSLRTSQPCSALVCMSFIPTFWGDPFSALCSASYWISVHALSASTCSQTQCHCSSLLSSDISPDPPHQTYAAINTPPSG